MEISKMRIDMEKMLRQLLAYDEAEKNCEYKAVKFQVVPALDWPNDGNFQV